MSRTTPHCACRNPQQINDENQKHNSKAYSLLPNYNNKTEIHRQSSKLVSNIENNPGNLSKSKYLCTNRNENDLKNYENIEYYTSGLFRPHSCPTDENNEIIDKPQSPIELYPECTLKNTKTTLQNHNIKPHDTSKQNEKYQRKYSKSNLKIEPKNLNINNLKVEEDNFQSNKHYFDSKYLDYNSGLSFYVKNSHIPLPDDERRNNATHNIYNEENILTNNIKKSSCGLKYIIFQKLSIMTHFITGSKNKKSSLISKHNNLSDENLFKEKSSRTKRSKSYHNLENNSNHIACNQCDNNCKTNSIKKQWKPKMSRVRLSNASNSSSGSIDAHAGSPIMIMTTVCGNILSNGPNPLVSNTFCHSSKTRWKNEEKSIEKPIDIKEYQPQKNYNQHKEKANNYQINQSNKSVQNNNHNNNNSSNNNNNNNATTFGRHSCNNYPCFSQQSYIPVPCDQMCRHQCCSQSYVQPPPQPCHYCCCNHSHVVMHPSYSQSPYMCCSPSNFLHHCSISKPICLHSFFPCNSNLLSNENCAQSILCSSCQAKDVDRCHSAHLTSCNKGLSSNSHSVKQSQNVYGSTQKYRSKPENRFRNFRYSPVNHSKTTSIPPPPPPPPSSLYSTKELTAYKPKQKRRHSNKSSNNGKVCTHCSEKMSVMNQDCADNVQNIIYSHLNNTVGCQSLKLNDIPEGFNQVKNSTATSDNRFRNLSKNISWNSTNEKNIENNFNLPNIDMVKFDDQQIYLSNEQTRCFNDERETMDRRSADIYRQRSSAVTPINVSQRQRFISKTPETYKSKYDRRQKNHQGETKRTLKHKNICTTREYNSVDQNGFCKKDSDDSPEAGSFIYSPVSPLMKKSSPTVAISNLSSFNIHQQHCNLKDKRNNNAEPARKAFQENMLSLREVGWYWGPLSFTEAERLMENKANGTFLVRDSGHDTYFLSLTFRVRETTYHTRIEYSQGTFSFWSQPESHSATTISEFVDKAVAHSQSGKFHYFLLTNVPGQPPMEVSLLYPLTRNQIVHSLKHLSRFVILSHIRKDHIANLNIPSPLKLYLLEKQYYISNFDQFIESTMDAHPLNYKPSITCETLDK